MSLGEKIDKKAEEMKKQRKKVYSQINRHNIAYRRIIKTIITVIALVIIYFNWNFLVSHLAGFLTQGVNVIQNRDQASVVANWLLFILIIATVGVEFMKVQRGWKSYDSKIAEGQRLHYNFVRPHSALEGQTPAEMAGVGIEGENKMLGLLRKAITTRSGTPEGTTE